MNGFDELDRIALVLDAHGRIDRVNQAWLDQGAERGLAAPDAWIGHSYLDLTWSASRAGADGAATTARALETLLRGDGQRLEVGYACDAPDRPAWKTLALRRLPDGGVLLVHFDTPDPRALHASERRLAEIAFRRILGIETRCAWCRRIAVAAGSWMARDPAPEATVTDGLCADCEARLLLTVNDRVLVPA